MPENATPGNITVPNELLKAGAFVTALGPPKLQKLNWKRSKKAEVKKFCTMNGREESSLLVQRREIHEHVCMLGRICGKSPHVSAMLSNM